MITETLMMQTEATFDAVNRARFAGIYPEQPSKLHHGLADHPLLQLESLVGLSQRLDPADVEYNAADLPIGVSPETVSGNGLSIADTIRSIENNRSWMVIKFVENDRQYKSLLNETLESLRPVIESATGDMLTLQGFIFISSPGAVTPFHMDPEHNILLQIRGEKDFTIFPAVDPEVLSDVEHERYHLGGHRNLPWRESMSAKGTTHRLIPCR